MHARTHTHTHTHTKYTQRKIIVEMVCSYETTAHPFFRLMEKKIELQRIFLRKFENLINPSIYKGGGWGWGLGGGGFQLSDWTRNV